MQQVRQVELNWTPTKKQEKAWEILNDNTTTEFLYGGSAGSGKSLLGVSWLIINCLRYPGTRWMMCRAVLKDLKASTLLTFFEICERWF